MNATQLLPTIKIASPCHAHWEDMTGDERSRFCSQCQKHVYNFSAMTAEGVAELIRAKEGKLCGRFYRRADGTMLTADCPVGAGKRSRRLMVLVGSAMALLFVSFTVRAWNSDAGSRQKGPFAQKCDVMLWKVKGWFGLNPKPAVMGMMVVRIPPPPPNPSSPGTPATSLPGGSPH